MSQPNVEVDRVNRGSFLGGYILKMIYESKDSSNSNNYNYGVAENEMFHIMLDSPYEGMIYVDENGIIRWTNAAFAQYNKMDVYQIIGRPHEEIVHDKTINNLLETRNFFEALVLSHINNKKFVTSRRPVYRNGQFAGIFCRYFSITASDVERYFGYDYIDLLAGLQTQDIMFNVSQTILELDSYKDEFQKANIARRGIDSIIGTTPVIKELKKRVLLVSRSPSSVLITGESGTGKELFAQAIHYHGNRSNQPFIKVNCAAIPENLLESELFGYEEGAFTGARKRGKLGKFELANRGTIFLDEIGDMPLVMQAKLLRVLQEKEIERLGGETSISIDVRVISATNKNLYSLVKEGKFREDLYYRLNVVNLHIPPLRERKNDIPDIIKYGIKELNRNLNQSIVKMSNEAIKLTLAYDWPGNIRELKNVLEATMNFCRSNIIDADALPYFLHSNINEPKIKKAGDFQDKIDEVEKEQLVAVLNQHRGKRKETAAELNLSKSTLYRLMRKHDLV